MLGETNWLMWLSENAKDEVRIMYEVEVRDGVHIVHLPGDIDISCASDARAAAAPLAEQGAKIVLDLTKATYLDSSGIAAVVETYSKARISGGSLVLVLSDAALKPIMLGCFDKIFEILPSVDEAVDLMRQRQVTSEQVLQTP